MADWSLPDRGWPTHRSYDPHHYAFFDNFYQDEQLLPLEAQTFGQQAPAYCSPVQLEKLSSEQTMLLSPPHGSPPQQAPAILSNDDRAVVPRGDNPREIRNKAEKQRRDKLNQSIAELAVMVPPVVAASRKIDKTGVLRLTAHYLRAHQYVFGDSIDQTVHEINSKSAQTLLRLLNGFLLTTTYKGIVVVVSQNVQQYLGYTELDLLGQNILNITHVDDHKLVKEQLMPRSNLLGPNGELLVPDEHDGKRNVADILSQQKRRFIVRFKKLTQRSEPVQYVTCHVEGSLRKSDRACRGYSRCCQMVRRARARGDNPRSSGNDVVFIGLVRPTSETFISESEMESFRMEYRTRHSVDGEIIHCDQRIALVTGYMTHEVRGMNAMNFMHRDDVRWVIIALREMYDQHRLYGESCYRLMAKNGQMVYMRTRGHLEVDSDTRAVTSFVCTNTVVDEEEGKHLIRLMKKKFTLLVNNNEEPPQEEDSEAVSDNQMLPVEDPRQLEKVILHLVTNLPAPQPEEKAPSVSPNHGASTSRLAIIPPRKERIISTIEKVYSILKTFNKEPEANMVSRQESLQDNKISIEKKIETSRMNLSTPVTKQLRPSVTEPFGTIVQSSSVTSPIQQSIRFVQATQPLPRVINYSNIHIRGQVDSAGNRTTNLNTNSTLMDPASFTASTWSELQVSPTTSKIGGIVVTNSQLQPRDNNVLFKTLTPRSNALVRASQPSAAKVKYHLFITSRINNDNKMTDKQDNPCLAPPQPSTSTGIKRANEFKEQETISKKKNTETEPKQEKRNDHTTGRSSPTLENFLDEAILDTQFSIDTALNSLEETIDPTFPDLLISQEVQDILGDIEEPVQEKKETN